jgi:putative CocE/NonD family hydrolase
MMVTHNLVPALLVLVAGLPVRGAAQEAETKWAAQAKAGYTKYEYRIPMRDGTRLFTAVYTPKDRSQVHPILLQRTPYSIRPYGADNYPDGLQPFALFGKGGYIFVYQDVRGRWMSEGQFVHMRPHIARKKPTDTDESTDTYDTIDWLLKHVPGNNGRVGLWGVSYPGFYAAAGMIDAHPALKAVSPQAPQADWFVGDDWHHNGALLALNMLRFMAIIDRPHPEPTTKPNPPVFTPNTPDGYEFCLRLGSLSEVGTRFLKGESPFWDEAIRHTTYDDFWLARNLRPHLKNINPAVMTVGGWFDAENLFGALEVYKSVQKNSPKTDSMLVMGPWFHGAWVRDDGAKLGDVTFNVKSAEYYREHIELPFFEHHLKGKGRGAHPGAWVFETGANIWRQHEAWPPKNVKPKALFFHSGGKLREDAPSGALSDEGYDEYPSDPSKPVPYEERISIRKSAEYMTADQRFAGRRPDVLVFRTDVLKEDVTIAGPIKADLFVSTTGTDSDYVVKVIDVYPDDCPIRMPNGPEVQMGGYQQLLRGDVMPGRFRNRFDNPEAFTPGKPTPVSFVLQDVYHTFRRGHRVMIQVQSTWFPLVDRNPQTFVEIPMAKPSDYRKAMQRIYRTPKLPSHVTVLVVPRVDTSPG